MNCKNNLYRVNQAHRTALIRYMALASPLEIARPSSEIAVVACTCNETHLGVGENWPCVFRSAASTGSSQTTLTGLSVVPPIFYVYSSTRGVV